MSPLLDVFIAGLPKGQPRVRARRTGNHVIMYDPGTADDWVESIRRSVPGELQSNENPEALALAMNFVFPRPKSHFRSGKYGHLLKDSAPTIHTGKPDLDNAIKLVCDALGTPKNPLIYSDDSCVVSIVSSKRWAKPGEASGVRLLVNEVGDQAMVETT